MAGVGAGTGAMSSLLGKLSDLLGDEYKLLKGVRKEIEFLKRELGRMHALLETLADMPKLDPVAKDWKGNVRDLSYDLEGCIDRFMDRLGSGDAKRGFMKKTARRLRTLWAHHDIATQIKDIKARVVEESQRRERYNLDESCKPARTVEIDPRLAAFHEEAKGFVAIDGPMKQVISWLMDEKVELKVVSIVGSGGLGKTTLAMEVYRKIGNGFQCRASVSVSRTLDLDKLLKDVLFQIDEYEYSKCQSENWEKEQLIHEIARFLTGKRYLIVIDDVWREQDWNFVKAAFPDNNNGSRIVATTRITSVASSCSSNSGDQLYQMAPLSDADSRRLFFKRIFRSDNSCPPHLEEVSASILKKCGGLPLAIITMASLLANKPQNKDEWERLQGSIGIDSSVANDGNLKGMKDILLLNYWDLPHHLKTCLLYLCIYPEDHIIRCAELKWKWIAEGFIATQGGNLDQEAENCLIELVDRSMIQSDVDYDSFEERDVDYDCSVKYCRVHDMVLDLIISLSNEENFATVLNGRVSYSLPSKIRRLSMQSSGQDHEGAIHAITESKLHVRSLNMFGQIEQIPTLVDFHALRVLDLKVHRLLQNKDIKNIGSLSQLRYLRLDSESITEIPEEIGKLRYLETLDLRGCESDITLPPTMVRLRKLVHLLVRWDHVFPAVEFGSMQALEEVSTIGCCDNPMKFAEELGHLRKLRKLTVVIRDWCPSDSDIFYEVLGSSIRELGKYNLEYLHIDGDAGAYVFRDPSCTFPRLQFLNISPPIGSVPRGMASLENLVKLIIHLSAFDEEDLQILMGMPSLAHLELSLLGAHVKRKPTVGGNGFKLLKVFHYSDLSPGTGIAFAPGAMPALGQFHLRLSAKAFMSRDYGVHDLGLEHLSGLAHLQVQIWCSRATLGEVEAVEGSIEKTIALHPNQHTLQVHVSREWEFNMRKDDKEREYFFEEKSKASEEALVGGGRGQRH